MGKLCVDCQNYEENVDANPCRDCMAATGIKPGFVRKVIGKFQTPPELVKDRNYNQLLNAYNAAAFKAALNSLFNAVDNVGRTKPMAMPNNAGLKQTRPLVRIKLAMDYINRAAKLLQSLNADCMEAAGINEDPLKADNYMTEKGE